MTGTRRPPRLLIRTLAVTFATVALLLIAVFVVVIVSVRDQVRQTVSTNLESGQRLFATVEARRQRELSEQAAALAESPRLKAAVDTYAAESGTNTDPVVREQWLTTIRRQLEEVAARIESDAIVLTDVHHHTLAVAGIVPLEGESYAFRRLVDLNGASFYALASIDESSRAATRTAVQRLLIIAAGATLLALAASFWLARMITGPIGHLSASLQRMAATREVAAGLTLTGSSLEIDMLTDTFNALITSVTAAEDQTQGAYTGAIRALAMALDARDPYTAGHSERVSVLSVAIGRSLRLRDEEIEIIRLGALLHDIGKIGVPDAVLLKPTALTPAEFDIIKQHPGAGARILQSVPFLAPHIPIVELHHERPDGKGYPHGLRGDEIPIAAHIVHVADAYDAMTTARAYRGARHPAAALQELWHFAGTGFHAEAVGALATVLPGVISDKGEVVLESTHA